MRVEEVWREHRRWSAAAAAATRSLERWRSVNLVLLVTGSLLGASATQDWVPRPAMAALGVAGAAALAVAGVVQTRVLRGDLLGERVRTRATSETLKGLVFQYLAAVAPLDGDDREAVLAHKVAEAERSAGSAAVAGRAPDAKPVPVVATVRDYVAARAEEQRDWHDREAGSHRDRAVKWRGAELLATSAAAVLAAAGGTLDASDLSAWVAVATTVGAALASHVAGAEHERLAAAYAATVANLNLLLRTFDPDRATPDQAAEFVAGVERVLVGQNDGWVALFAPKSTGRG